MIQKRFSIASLGLFLVMAQNLHAVEAKSEVSARQGDGRVCVLSYERSAHPISEILIQTFLPGSNADLFLEALPKDLSNCFLGNYREIIFIAHAVEDPAKSNQVSLGYFSKTDRTHYQLLSFLPQIFRQIHIELQRKKHRGEAISVKRIRWLTCLPSEVFAVYPEIKTILKEFGIGLDLAPKQVVLSFAMAKTVTAFDRLWIAESAQAEDDSQQQSSFFSYLHLTTLGIARFGNAIALHGKYRIHYQGLALGLASTWTELYIRYEDLRGLQIGESREIRGLHIDFSVGLATKLEVKLAPIAEFESSTSLNNLGAALGIWEDVSVQRLF